MSDRQVNLTTLRERAQRAIEQGLAGLPAEPDGKPEQALAELIEELRIYQAELEIQNQELSDAHAENLQSLEKYRALFENLPLPAILIDLLDFIAETNEAARQFLNLNLNLSRIAALYRTSVLQFFDHDGRAELFPQLERARFPQPGRWQRRPDPGHRTGPNPHLLQSGLAGLHRRNGVVLPWRGLAVAGASGRP